jgi:hypothetical protein
MRGDRERSNDEDAAREFEKASPTFIPTEVMSGTLNGNRDGAYSSRRDLKHHSLSVDSADWGDAEVIARAIGSQSVARSVAVAAASETMQQAFIPSTGMRR